MDTQHVTLAFRPIMALHAARNGFGGPYRAWVIAFNICDGSGVVRADLLNQRASDLGIPVRRWAQWLQEAEAEGFLRRIDRRRRGEIETIYLLAGQVRVARIVGCRQTVGFPAEIEAELLLGRDCVHYIWAAFLTTLPGDELISRGWMRQETGVPETTQRRYEQDLKICTTSHYAVLKKAADHLDGIREYHVSHAIKFRVHSERKIYVAYRLPDSRVVVEDGVASLKRARTRYLNADLRAICGRVDAERTRCRRYFNTLQLAQAALRHMAQLAARDVPHADLPFVYAKRSDQYCAGTMLWDVVCR